MVVLNDEYFMKGFYEDHIKRYKKRPGCWMVASLKKGFMSLIYVQIRSRYIRKSMKI